MKRRQVVVNGVLQEQYEDVYEITPAKALEFLQLGPQRLRTGSLAKIAGLLDAMLAGDWDELRVVICVSGSFDRPRGLRDGFHRVFAALASGRTWRFRVLTTE